MSRIDTLTDADLSAALQWLDVAEIEARPIDDETQRERILAALGKVREVICSAR